jgi:hypothetical protein
MNMDVFEARKNLVDVLIKVVGESLTYEDVVSELKILLGDITVAKFSAGNSMPVRQWARLVTQLSELEAGLSPLIRVLEQYLGLAELPRSIAPQLIPGAVSR